MDLNYHLLGNYQQTLALKAEDTARGGKYYNAVQRLEDGLDKQVAAAVQDISTVLPKPETDEDREGLQIEAFTIALAVHSLFYMDLGIEKQMASMTIDDYIKPLVDAGIASIREEAGKYRLPSVVKKEKTEKKRKADLESAIRDLHWKNPEDKRKALDGAKAELEKAKVEGKGVKAAENAVEKKTAELEKAENEWAKLLQKIRDLGGDPEEELKKIETKKKPSSDPIGVGLGSKAAVSDDADEDNEMEEAS